MISILEEKNKKTSEYESENRIKTHLLSIVYTLHTFTGNSKGTLCRGCFAAVEAWIGYFVQAGVCHWASGFLEQDEYVPKTHSEYLVLYFEFH